MKWFHRWALLGMVVVLSIAGCNNGCGTNDPEPEAPLPPCAEGNIDKLDYTTTQVTLTPGGPEVSVVTPETYRDCHCSFLIEYQWADTIHSIVDSVQPPVHWSFQIWPGFFYMAGMKPATRMRGSMPGSPNDDAWYWVSHLSAAAKGVEDKLVKYQTVASLDASAKDDVILYIRMISYRLKK